MEVNWLLLVTFLLSLIGFGLPMPCGTSNSKTAASSNCSPSERISHLEHHYHGNLLRALSNRTGGCTAQTIATRREWSTLPPATRKSFTSAIHCLNNISACTSPWIAPGARTRYDDLIVAHIQQTPYVHASGLFLPFHRHFLHLFEQMLRHECAYAGPLPYWDSSMGWTTASSNTLFASGEESMGGNGEFVAGRNGTEIVLPGGGIKMIPPATGGGCVKSGPFAEGKWEVRLGPVGYEPQGPDGGLGYNPRCLTRDLSPEFAWGTRPSAVVDVVDGCDTLGCFVQELDAPGGVPGGLHASGHWQVGLNALDVFASPSDPVFWLHHAQIDRVWTMWQGQDLERRTWEVWGTSTAANIPPSDNVTLDTRMDFGFVGSLRTIGEVSSTIDGEYCYMYE